MPVYTMHTALSGISCVRCSVFGIVRVVRSWFDIVSDDSVPSSNNERANSIRNDDRGKDIHFLKLDQTQGNYEAKHHSKTCWSLRIIGNDVKLPSDDLGNMGDHRKRSMHGIYGHMVSTALLHVLK